MLHFSCSGSLPLTQVQQLPLLWSHLPLLSQSATPVALPLQSATPVAPPLQSAPVELHQLHPHSSAAIKTLSSAALLPPGESSQPFASPLVLSALNFAHARDIQCNLNAFNTLLQKRALCHEEHQHLTDIPFSELMTEACCTAIWDEYDGRGGGSGSLVS